MISLTRTGLQLVILIMHFFFFGKGVYAQYPDISFKHLSTVDGLSNFTVLSITQDRQGFMWFGTMDGLNRFDGKQIRTYRHNSTTQYSLGNNFVHSLLCTSDSGLWVGTGQGLYYYDYQHDDFHFIPILDQKGDFIEDLEIKTMVYDDEFIWIGTSNGMFKYDLVKASIMPYLSEEQNRISETVEALHKSDDGSIWIGGKQGLMVYQQGKLKRISNDVNKKYHDETNVISINSDEYGNIWFGTLDLETGLIIYNPDNGEFKDLNAQEGFISHNKVNCLYRFQDGKIWVGTTWGLSIID
jgi:ligand-binding sensor domain-containing protein